MEWTPEEQEVARRVMAEGAARREAERVANLKQQREIRLTLIRWAVYAVLITLGAIYLLVRFVKFAWTN